MAIVLYNSLTRTKEALAPVVPGQVGMYVCGPTVYDDCHIGHLMGPVLFDAIARWMRARGLSVRFVNNITDIDDKIINRARDTGEPWTAIVERYTTQYLDLLARLRVATITDHPRATGYIDGMIAYIQDLESKGIAYRAADGVYYEVHRHDGYGKLTQRNPDDMEAGARIDPQSGLRHPADFCLWKLAKPGEPSWPSPWGAGRPGWHIECSVMSSTLLGDTFDIHGGGDDLKFPHHENEIAQGEAHGGDYAHVWMHNGLIQYEGSKISKSDPRNKDPAFRGQFKALNVLATYGAPAVRFFILSGHYRRPFDFAPRNLASARTAYERLLRQLGPALAETAEPRLEELLALAVGPEANALREGFCAALDDDCNTGQAIAKLHGIAALARKASGQEADTLVALWRGLGRLIGLFHPADLADLHPAAASAAPETAGAAATVDGLMQLIIQLRQQARANRDFPTADRIREHLAGLNIAILDGKDGSRWEQK